MLFYMLVKFHKFWGFLAIPNSSRGKLGTVLSFLLFFPNAKAELQKFIKNSKKIQIDQNFSLNCMKLNPLSVCPIYFTRIRVYVI